MTAVFGMRIINLDTGSYLFIEPGKAVVKEDAIKYLQTCMGHRSYFILIV